MKNDFNYLKTIRIEGENCFIQVNGDKVNFLTLKNKWIESWKSEFDWSNDYTIILSTIES